MECSLIICTYNWPEALKLVLKSVEQQSDLPNEVIIADDGSDHSTLEVISQFSSISQIPIIHSWQEDKGCRIPHSRNRAIARSHFDYIVMIDGDTILHKDFIKEHKMFAEKGIYIQGSRVLLQPKFTSNLLMNGFFRKPSILFKHAKNKLNMIHFPLLTSILCLFKNKDIRRVRGCNYSIYKEDIFKVNGFNEEITTWGREDSEFVQRLFNSGVYKKYLKFSGIQYHLYHEERVEDSKKSANSNNFFFENAIKQKLVRCNIGIDRYL